MRDLMFKGKRTYSEFAASEERISSNILAERLRALASEGIIRKDGTGRATRYSLTAKGLDLLPLMVEMILWSGKHDQVSSPQFFSTINPAESHRHLTDESPNPSQSTTTNARLKRVAST